MRRTARGFTLVGLIVAGASALTVGTAAASTPRSGPGEACFSAVRSNAMPVEWIPRSPAEADRRITWNQVRAWDRDGNGRLSDPEIARFRAAAAVVPGGPRCERPANPPRRG